MQTLMTATVEKTYVVSIKFNNGAKRLLIKTTNESAAKASIIKVKNSGLLKNGVIVAETFVLHNEGAK